MEWKLQVQLLNIKCYGKKFALLKYTQVIIPDIKDWEINVYQLQHKWQEQAS